MDEITSLPNLTIRFVDGYGPPSFKDNILTLYHYQTNYNDYQKIDLSFDDTFIFIGVISYNLHFSYQPHYYVYDYGGWNRRLYHDLSVQYHLQRVKQKTVFYKQRSKINIDFGRTNKGKEALLQLVDTCQQRYPTINDNETVRLRNWDQSKEIYLRPTKTKLTIGGTVDIFDNITSLFRHFDFPHYILQEVEKKRLEAIFEPIDLDLDLRSFFKENKAKK